MQKAIKVPSPQKQSIFHVSAILQVSIILILLTQFTNSHSYHDKSLQRLKFPSISLHKASLITPSLHSHKTQNTPHDQNCKSVETTQHELHIDKSNKKSSSSVLLKNPVLRYFKAKYITNNHAHNTPSIIPHSTSTREIPKSCATIFKMKSSRGGSSSQQYQYGLEIMEKLRVALAGGIAGATGTAVLYPIDTAKTLRQADPARYASVSVALKDLMLGVAGEGNAMGLRKAYSGVIAASLFSIPSSALYFGAYETCKQTLSDWINHLNEKRQQSSSSSSSSSYIPSGKQRLFIHAVSAFSGNTCSSLIYVPKEYIKQQMQAYGSGAMSLGNDSQKQWLMKQTTTVGSGKLLGMRKIVHKTIREKGVRGLYSGYQSTLMRNVPSAVMRFALYEELKLRWMGKDKEAYAGGGISPKFFMSGALAGALSSGLMTPLDVIKTRVSTNTIPPNLGFARNVQWILTEHGWHGLYAGVRARMVWSGAFSAIGFGTFEAAKNFLGAKKSTSDEYKENPYVSVGQNR